METFISMFPMFPNLRELKMINATELNHSYNLLSLVEKDTTLRKTGASWYAGPCPFCGGDDRFVLKRTIEGWRWFCRHCGSEGYHSPIDYIMRRESLDFRVALKWAGGDVQPANRQKETSKQQELESSTPPEAWRCRALAFVESCELALWSEAGKKALDYLHGRGLKDETLKKYHIGYNPGEQFDPMLDWGLPKPDDGKRHAVWMPRGVVISCFMGGELWYVKFRRPITKEQEAQGEQKYIKLKGSKPGIFGADNLRGAWLAVLTEGEFDSMLLDQEAGDLVGVATLGSATDRLSRLDWAVWGHYLLPIAHILAVYDLDSEGEKGIRALEGFSERVHHAPLPALTGVKDITDFWKAGRDLGNWLIRTVEDLGVLPAGGPFDLTTYLLVAAEKITQAGDLGNKEDRERFARLWAAIEPDPIIPWAEFVEF